MFLLIHNKTILVQVMAWGQGNEVITWTNFAYAFFPHGVTWGQGVELSQSLIIKMQRLKYDLFSMNYNSSAEKTSTLS